MISAVDAAALAKATKEKHKNRELEKMKTVMTSIEARARAGHDFFLYKALLTRAMAKTLIEGGYTLKHKGEYKLKTREGWYGSFKVFDQDKATPLTMENYKEASAYPDVFIFWGEKKEEDKND